MQVITAREAVSKVKDGDCVGFTTFGLAGNPMDMMLAFQEAYKETGHPKGLTIVHGAGAGRFKPLDQGGLGMEYMFTEKGLVTKMLASHNGDMPEVMKQTVANEFPAWYFPLGTMLQNYSESGRGMKGMLTKVGLGTFIDPRFDGGALNQKAKDSGEEWVKYIPDLDGEEYLWYRAYPVNVAIIRGTYADESGNISLVREALNLEVAEMARTAKQNGGIVIVQVEKLVQNGYIHPKHVAVPGILVDYVVESTRPDVWFQTHQTQYNPAFSGEIRVPTTGGVKPLPFNENKVINRRIAMEIRKGNLCNFGLGIIQGAATILAEEGCADDVIMISESGSVGGVPMPGLDFGAHLNIEASINHKNHFDWFDCMLLDFGTFGLSEIDRHGNMNSSNFGGRLGGVGGIMNIVRAAKNCVFGGSFTAKGLQVRIEDGKVHIDQEGSIKKFVDTTSQISINAEQKVKAGHKITYVTERCVLIRDERGVVLTEIAPGIDLQKDILDQMEFMPVIPEGGPKSMDPAIFQEVWGGLKDYMNK